MGEDVVNRLSECALDVPFILLEQENLPETFERICANRVQFEWEGNSSAKTLQCAGVELACG